MDYPKDFAAESISKVEEARIRARRQFDSGSAKAQSGSEIDGLFWTYVLTPFLVFAGESSRLALWPIDKMDLNCREFLRRLTIEAYYSRGKGAVRDPISNWNGGLLREAEQQIEKTPQWRKYENILLKLAKGSSRAENSDKTTQGAESNSAMESRNRGGRPRNDAERKLVRQKKDAGKSWKVIANEVNAETDQDRTAEAYRGLLRSCAKSSRKNVQN